MAATCALRLAGDNTYGSGELQGKGGYTHFVIYKGIVVPIYGWVDADREYVLMMRSQDARGYNRAVRRELAILSEPNARLEKGKTTYSWSIC